MLRHTRMCVLCYIAVRVRVSQSMRVCGCSDQMFTLWRRSSFDGNRGGVVRERARIPLFASSQTDTHTRTHAYGWCSPTCGHWHRTAAPMLCVFATEFMCDYIYVWVCVPAQKGFWTGNKCVGGCVWMCACLCCALNWMRIVWTVNLCAHMILGNISRTRRGRRLSRVFLSCVYKQLDWDD